jgi:RNA polymerase subunit RPABC4/transcription elongation factor Spt4
VVDTSQSVYQLIVVALVVVVLGAGLLFVVRRRFKARIAALRGQTDGPAEFADDRSYNLLRIARAEADTLKRQGVDVRVAEAALADAEASMRHRDYDIAVLNARRAHDLLVGLRQHPPTAPPVVSPARSSHSMTPPVPNRAPSDLPNDRTPLDADVPDGAPGPEAPVPRLAKNRAESHFQIGLLDEELSVAGGTRPDDDAVREAQASRSDAQAAYDRGDYTEAMRLALRGRRKLGARIETLPPPNTRIPPTPPPVAPSQLGGPSGTVPCVQCGRPLKSADRFCRACGTPKAPTACPSCGTAVDEGDRFCPACGATMA